MQKQQNQWKSSLIPIIFTVSFLIVFTLLFKWARDAASPITAFAVVGVLLLLAAVTYILLWGIPNEDTWLKLIYPLYTFLTSVAIPIIAFLLLAVSKAGYLSQLGIGILPAFILIAFGVVFIWVIALWQLRRKKERKQPTGDEEKSLEVEFQAALRRRATGWGMTPQETLRQGWGMIGVTFIVTGGGSIALFFALLHTASFQTLNGIIYLLFGGFMLVGAVWVLFYLTRQGLRLILAGRAGREQQEGMVNVKGVLVSSWLDANRNGINGELVKLQLHDGTSKIFYVKAALMDDLPDGEEPEIQIDYLFGCEAVVAVKALSAVSSSQVADTQESDEE